MNIYITDAYQYPPSREYSINEYVHLHNKIERFSKSNPTGWIRLTDSYEIALLCKYWPDCYMYISRGWFGFNKFTFQSRSDTEN